MRKIVLGSVVLIFVSFALLLLEGTIRKFHKQKLLKENISILPLFTFKTLYNKAFYSSEIVDGPILVVNFHPECEHCKYEVSEIFKSNIPKSFTKVILISSAHPDSIRNFLKQFNYTDYKSVIPLVDTSFSFQEVFGKGSIPSSYIYSRKLKLIKVFHGEVKTENLLNCIKSE